MFNCCSSGVGVVNIENGFGTAYLASTIIKQKKEGKLELWKREFYM
ncbi:hypothetical protein [Oceanirhabdus seepicola]|uniref:Uncharacterized protein n=1 Tax=Oceanirhabdus seepicola TaxID=2828781 RepID=A0A9J6P564_9CLOT|nr:hypothetical protein [Oceanirhabdus seepicola]MCM1991388.1 hypothetical protein [Oceanirhabdus seepicola]